MINLLRVLLTVSRARSTLAYQQRYVVRFAVRLLVNQPLATISQGVRKL